MKKILLSTVLLSLLGFVSNRAEAQDGYTYTLVSNGNYNFTIQAVPNISSNNFETSVKGYGFTIILPAGVTATLTSSLGGAANASFFDGNVVGQSSIDGYIFSETIGTPATLAAPVLGINSDIISFTVNGNPTSGTMYILENNSALATTISPLKSFMQADMIDDNSVQFVNVVDPNGSAVSGMSSFNFETLGTTDLTLQNVSVYPNPVDNTLFVESSEHIKFIRIIDISGRLVAEVNRGSNAINVEYLTSGYYFLKLTGADNQERTIKFLKN